MSDEGFQERAEAGEARAQARNLSEMDEHALEGPGSDARLERLRARFRESRRKSEARGDRMPTSQLVLIGIFVFLLVLMFGAGRYIIAALAPKPPPGVVLTR
jgi:hypothetical protein